MSSVFIYNNPAQPRVGGSNIYVFSSPSIPYEKEESLYVYNSPSPEMEGEYLYLYSEVVAKVSVSALRRFVMFF